MSKVSDLKAELRTALTDEADEIQLEIDVLQKAKTKILNKISTLETRV